MDNQAIFKKMCLIRHFELQAAQACEQQMTPGPVYLSVGQEAPADRWIGIAETLDYGPDA